MRDERRDLLIARVELDDRLKLDLGFGNARIVVRGLSFLELLFKEAL